MNWAQFFSVSMLSLLFSMSEYNSSNLQADDWGPQLNPPTAMKYSASKYDASYDDMEYEESDAGKNFMPNRLAVRTKTFNPLPDSGVSPRSRNATGRQVRFDPSSLEPSDVILPTRFLEEETPGNEKSTNVPKPLKKNPGNLKNLETADSVTPQSEDDFVQYDSTGADEVYYDDEYVVSGYPVLGGSLFGGFGLCNSFGGNACSLYDQCSPALESCYTGPPIIKPFGTGLLDNLTFFIGSSGFKSELDAGHGGSFGISEGFNWSGPATPQCLVSAQVGFRAIQADVRGNENYPQKNSRNQYFVTAGFFKRDLCYPIQGGAVFDWYEDNFYGKVQVKQVRCEISVRTFSNIEYGFLGGFGIDTDSNAYINVRENLYHGNPVNLSYSVYSDNYYLLFGRKHLANGGLVEGRAGATDRGDFILSGMAEFPINDHLSLNGGFRTMIPSESRHNGGWRKESWDVSVGMVFYFRGGACTKPCNPCRPMFDVAGNGSFMTKIKQK